jgi:hypothetical protein
LHSITVAGTFMRPGRVVIGAESPRAGNIVAQNELDVLAITETVLRLLCEPRP